MVRMDTTEQSALSPGDVIVGVRHRTSYRIARMLGAGANGQVYLATYGRKAKPCAIKLGAPGSDLELESALLREVSPKTMYGQPFFWLADSVVWEGTERPFYVMSYVEGQSLSSFIEQRAVHWLYLTGYHILRKLAVTHGKGYVFGDLKSSNLIVSPEGRIELVDYGAAALMGSILRQITELYDREYWNCGSRQADCGYDLFSFALLFMQHAGAALPGSPEMQVLPQHRSLAELEQAVMENDNCRPVANVLKSMLAGRYTNSRQALDEWRQAIGRIGIVPKVETSSSAKRMNWIAYLSIAVGAAGMLFYWFLQ